MEPFFTFHVKTTFLSKRRFDQCGILLYQDSDNWLKASVEYENERFARLGSVVTNRGYSDWATQDIPAQTQVMHYRLSRRQADFLVEYSQDGIHFHQMRIAHLFLGEGEVRFGLYAASPEDSSFEAVFEEVWLGACLWGEHQ